MSSCSGCRAVHLQGAMLLGMLVLLGSAGWVPGVHALKVSGWIKSPNSWQYLARFCFLPTNFQTASSVKGQLKARFRFREDSRLTLLEYLERPGEEDYVRARLASNPKLFGATAAPTRAVFIARRVRARAPESVFPQDILRDPPDCLCAVPHGVGRLLGVVITALSSINPWH
jgi:hypothetical protein